jgi:hypothetical protein
VLEALAYLPPERLEEVLSLAEGRLPPINDDEDATAFELRVKADDSLAALAIQAARAGRIATAVAAIRLTTEIGRSEVFQQLVPLLPNRVLPDVAALTDEIDVLGQIAVRLGEGGSWDEALAYIGTLLDQYDRVRSSADDPATPIAQVAAIIPRGRLPDLLALAQRLPEDEQAKALPPIIERLSRSDRRPVLEHTLESTSSALLAALAPHAARVSARLVVEAWSRSLRRADESGGAEVLNTVQALGPAVATVCGPSAAIAIHEALNAVGRSWWPGLLSVGGRTK